MQILLPCKLTGDRDANSGRVAEVIAGKQMAEVWYRCARKVSLARSEQSLIGDFLPLTDSVTWVCYSLHALQERNPAPQTRTQRLRPSIPQRLRRAAAPVSNTGLQGI